MGCTQPQKLYVKVMNEAEKIGSAVDFTIEHRAAKTELNVTTNEFGPALSLELVDALYRCPGSQ